MRIRLLGTGSADGWPNAFCGCASCSAERQAGRSRRSSCALIDDQVLIDCGPGAQHASASAGLSLRSVEHVLLTHGHPDHLDPAFLLSRHWAAAPHVLHVWGPAHAVDLCREWLAPDDPVVLHVLSPGERAILTTAGGDYAVRALPAAHSSGNGDRLADEALLFDVSAPDGHRLLYATDTGPLPDGTIAQIEGPLDALLIDETFGDTADHGTGHLDLRTITDLLDRLRSAGVLTQRTRTAVTHLSHHNPPTAVLRERLRPLGVLVPDDLDVIDTATAVHSPRRQFVIGGARSGKSAHAERLAASWGGAVTYVATGGSRPGDIEWAKRVAEHQARRPAEWSTVETLDLADALLAASAGGVVLVDCLTLWLTGTLDDMDAWARHERGGWSAVRSDLLLRVDALTEAIGACAADLVIVSNEVGWGVVPATSSGRLFRDLMGRVNAEVAAACDGATLVVAGLGLPLGRLVTASQEGRP